MAQQPFELSKLDLVWRSHPDSLNYSTLRQSRHRRMTLTILTILTIRDRHFMDRCFQRPIVSSENRAGLSLVVCGRKQRSETELFKVRAPRRFHLRCAAFIVSCCSRRNLPRPFAKQYLFHHIVSMWSVSRIGAVDFIRDLRGSTIVKEVPSFSEEVAVMLPAWEVTISRAMYSPNPMLPGRLTAG
jgi:hypothetical protein